MRASPFWIAWGTKLYPAFFIHTPLAHVVIGLWRDRLFSERYGYVWCRRVGPLRITIRGLRRRNIKDGAE